MCVFVCVVQLLHCFDFALNKRCTLRIVSEAVNKLLHVRPLHLQCVVLPLLRHKLLCAQCLKAVVVAGVCVQFTGGRQMNDVRRDAVEEFLSDKTKTVRQSDRLLTVCHIQSEELSHTLSLSYHTFDSFFLLFSLTISLSFSRN